MGGAFLANLVSRCWAGYHLNLSCMDLLSWVFPLIYLTLPYVQSVVALAFWRILAGCTSSSPRRSQSPEHTMSLNSSASTVRVTSRPTGTNAKPTASSAPSSRRGSVDKGVVAPKPATKQATNAPSDKKNKENSKPVAAKEPEPQMPVLSEEDLARMKAATDALSDIIEQGQIAAEELRVRAALFTPASHLALGDLTGSQGSTRPTSVSQPTFDARVAPTRSFNLVVLPKFTPKASTAKSCPKTNLHRSARSSCARKPRCTSCRAWPSVDGGGPRTSRSRRWPSSRRSSSRSSN